MEADGTTRVYLLKDRDGMFAGEGMHEVFPVDGPEISREDSGAVIDRTDLMYTVGGIVWNKPETLIVEGRVGTDAHELKKLCEAAEVVLRKSGLTIVIDRLSPEDIRYASE